LLFKLTIHKLLSKLSIKTKKLDYPDSRRSGSVLSAMTG